MTKGGIELTEAYIQGLMPRDKQYDVYDAKERGLILRVNTSGMKSYRAQWARGKAITFAQYGELNLREARLKAKEIIVAGKNGQLEKEHPRSKDITYSEFLETVYKDFLLANRETGLETYKVLNSTFCPEYGKKFLQAFTFQDGTKWQQKMLKTVLPITVNKYMSYWKASFTYAVQYGYIAKNPFAGIKKLKEAKSEKHRCFTREEEPRFLKALLECSSDNELRVKAMLGWKTGPRPKEVSTVVLSDIDLRRETCGIFYRFTKTGETRFVPLGGLARIFLYLYLRKKFRPSGIKIFKTYESVDPKYRQKIFELGSIVKSHRKSWARLMKKANVKSFTSYCLRHDFITRMLIATKDIYHVAKLAGTSPEMIMKTYGKVIQQHAANQIALIDNRAMRKEINRIDRLAA